MRYDSIAGRLGRAFKEFLVTILRKGDFKNKTTVQGSDDVRNPSKALSAIQLSSSSGGAKISSWNGPKEMNKIDFTVIDTKWS